MSFASDYGERVYAGILGKIIGVYIISGTFTFLRAMADWGYSLELTPAQIGQTWLNYIIENRTILWWGGLGNSTEHTAYLRLKNGIPAPRSGSMALNGKVVAEQIGAQIFIEGWGLIAPGDPGLAVDLARRAASVSHDGEAIYGAQVVAALVAQAFVESDIDKLLDTAVALIPADSLTYRLIADVRDWRAAEPDWHAARAKLAARYGYDKYGGNCHIIPNHGLVILSLLYGDGDFSCSQTIVNTCGWDTDCNAANVGCILGVRNGLAAFETGPDWRGPVADQLYNPTADGGRAISDAVQETYHVLEIAHALRDEPLIHPKHGARFHFSFPGAVQGFRPYGCLNLENCPHPAQPTQRALALRYQLKPGESAAAMTPTFTPPDAIDMPGYELLASPTLYPGQRLRANLLAGKSNTGPVECRLALQFYGENDLLETSRGPAMNIAPGRSVQLEWQIPDLAGAPAARIGISISSGAAPEGVVYLDYLTWDGNPQVDFLRPAAPGTMWRRQWVDAVHGFEDRFEEAFRLVQNHGRGLAISGTREWTDYHVQAVLVPHLAKAFGLAARVQGLERYYALLLSDREMIRLVRRLDGETVLAEQHFAWEFGRTYDLRLAVQGNHLRAWLGARLLFAIKDLDRTLSCGGIALVCEEGRVGTDLVSVGPVSGM